MTRIDEAKKLRKEGLSITKIAKRMNIPYHKLWAYLNSDKKRVYRRNYYLKHPDKVRAYRRRYYLKHREEILAKRRKHLKKKRLERKRIKRERLVEEIHKILKEKGAIKVSELFNLLPKGYKTPMYKILNPFDYHIFVVTRKGRKGSQKYGAPQLFNGFVGSTKYICLYDDHRVIDFIADSIPKPLTRDKVRALRHHLTRTFNNKRLVTMIIEKAGYNYSNTYNPNE